MRPAGQLRWFIEMQHDTISGNIWKGWNQWFEFKLSDGAKVNSFRVASTWELNGQLHNLTVVNMRYRGLGRIEQQLQCNTDGENLIPFTTTETLKNWAYDTTLYQTCTGQGNTPARCLALALRANSWTAHHARGARTSFFDFQFRPIALFAAFPEKQGNFRALTEANPGDRLLSQLDEEWFPLTASFTTSKMKYRMLVSTAKPLTVYECRNRWKEMDIFLRKKISDELGFIQYNAMPAVGMNWDFWRPEYTYKHAIDSFLPELERLAGAGVKMVVTHNSCWINGRSVKNKWDGTEHIDFIPNSANPCQVYDWVPLPSVEKPWREMYSKMNSLDMSYYVWVTGMSVKDAGFTSRVGTAPRHWALNSPGGTPNETYGEHLLKHNILDSTFSHEFTKSLLGTRKNYGFNGIWGDAFHHLYMNQLDWANGTGNSMQRSWWEYLAMLSRDSIGFISESTSFPGLNCSIETDSMLYDWWYFQYTQYWFRNGHHKHYTSRQLSELLFKIMSNKGWVFTDLLEYGTAYPYTHPDSIIENFSQYAKMYNSALAYMDQPYILPDGAGIIWQNQKQGTDVVIFSYQPIKLAVKAKDIITGKETDIMPPFTVAIAPRSLIQKMNIRTDF